VHSTESTDSAFKTAFRSQRQRSISCRRKLPGSEPSHAADANVAINSASPTIALAGTVLRDTDDPVDVADERGAAFEVGAVAVGFARARAKHCAALS
jgi:hypothetical protein